jgi:hypothetical protein
MFSASAAIVGLSEILQLKPYITFAVKKNKDFERNSQLITFLSLASATNTRDRVSTKAISIIPSAHT